MSFITISALIQDPVLSHAIRWVAMSPSSPLVGNISSVFCSLLWHWHFGWIWISFVDWFSIWVCLMFPGPGFAFLKYHRSDMSFSGHHIRRRFILHWELLICIKGRGEHWKEDIPLKHRVGGEFQVICMSTFFFDLPIVVSFIPSKHFIQPSTTSKLCSLTHFELDLDLWCSREKKVIVKRQGKLHNVIFVFSISIPSTEGIIQGHFYWVQFSPATHQTWCHCIFRVFIQLIYITHEW